MCIYYLISFTKSIYFLLNFQIPFMFWIIILPLNILYYPTNESLCRLFSSFWAGFGSCFGDFCCFNYFFLGFFPAFWLGLGSCFGDFCSFSYFFSAFFRLFGLILGSCFGDFCSFSYFLPVFFRLFG